MAVHELNYTFLTLLFIVAFLYSSVGHGGASGYLALMALFNFEPGLMKSSALLMNIFVSMIAFLQYYRGGYFKWKLFWPFAAASIPAAFLGAYIGVDPAIYKKVLGVLLIFPVLRLFGLFDKKSDEIKEPGFPISIFIGMLIGFFSGMTGIGGGIILSPIILLMHWANMKQTAAVSALFIFVNSISGLVSLLSKGTPIDHNIYTWLVLVIVAGTLGAYYGRQELSNTFLKRVLAIVLVIASIKLVAF